MGSCVRNEKKAKGRKGSVSSSTTFDSTLVVFACTWILHSYQWFWLQGAFPFITLEFHGGVGRILNQPLYPTQLWSAASGILIGSLLIWAWKYRKFDGMIAGLVLATEPLTRIFVESFRADNRGYVLSMEVSDAVAQMLPSGLSKAGSGMEQAMIGITTSQFIGLCLFLAGILILIVQRNAGRVADPTPAAPEAAYDDIDI